MPGVLESAQLDGACAVLRTFLRIVSLALAQLVDDVRKCAAECRAEGMPDPATARRHRLANEAAFSRFRAGTMVVGIEVGDELREAAASTSGNARDSICERVNGQIREFLQQLDAELPRIDRSPLAATPVTGEVWRARHEAAASLLDELAEQLQPLLDETREVCLRKASITDSVADSVRTIRNIL